MDENTKKEQFSYAYIHMIATLAGFETIVTGRPSDHSGIDLIIRAPGRINGLFSPSIDAQVKCVSTAKVNESFVKYSLPLINYRRLIGESQAWQILILVLVPKDLSNFLNISDSKTIFSAPTYWINLKGYPHTSNKDNITVNVPKDNLLTPHSLKNIMEEQVQEYKDLFSLDDILD